MGSDTKKPRAAFMEDCDEEDKVVRGTKQSASTKVKSKGERKHRTTGDGTSNMNSVYLLQTVTLGEKSSSSRRVEVVKVPSPSAEKESRRKSTSGTTPRSPTKSSSRPPLTRTNVTSPPKLNTELPSRPRADPSYFGVSPNSTYTPASSSSTRSARPLSYYAGMPIPIPTPTSAVSRPPIARSAFYMAPPGSTMGVSYPQASPTNSYMGIGYTVSRADPYVVSETSWTAPNPLAERFTRGMDPISRTTSAQSVRGFPDAFDLELERRNSARRRAREAEDMPPPPIPGRRQSLAQVVNARDIYGNDIRYEPQPSRPAYRDPSPVPHVPRRPSVNRNLTYDYARDLPNYRIETSNQARRSSYYDGQRRSSDYEDKVREAAGYQEEVGGQPVSLTAEALRKQQRTTASSRSTRSSGSHDESDFRRSATTRTTTSRFDADGENVTIKFKGDATINIAGAEIKCDDGAELNIKRSKNGSIRNGSERGGSEYGVVPLADRRSRDPYKSSNYSSRSTSKSGFSNPFPTRTAYQPASFF